jgi:hypothetical protein
MVRSTVQRPLHPDHGPPIPVITMADPGDHDGDPGDHDAAIPVITMARSA